MLVAIGAVGVGGARAPESETARWRRLRDGWGAAGVALRAGCDGMCVRGFPGALALQERQRCRSDADAAGRVATIARMQSCCGDDSERSLEERRGSGAELAVLLSGVIFARRIGA